jgi:carbon starvation protein
MLNAAIIGIIGALWFGLMYRWYGNVIDKHLIRPEEDAATPAHTMTDNVDYVPTHPAILFGHHFSSIAGAGPIVGPMLAYSLFGWLPALLWVLLGSVFIGAVHDYTALMTSVRSKGVSIAELAQENVSNTARWIFSIFLWLALVLVIAVFAIFTAQTLAEKPAIVVPTVGLMLLAMLFGLSVYKKGMNIWLGTTLALAFMFILIILGDVFPVRASYDFWLIFALAYSLVAATLPVWILLQPRDYLSMYILIIGLGLSFISLLVMHPQVNGPMFIGFSSTKGPIWPILFITVACGAVSGFHSVVSSGTSAKQLSKESDGRKVAFGGMLTEGALAMVVILLMSSVLFWKTAPSEDVAGFVFQTLLSGQGPNITFGTAIGRVMETIGIPIVYGTAFGVLMLNAFILTTLDTCARLTRFIVTETVGTKVSLLKNRYIATAGGLIFAFFLTFGHSGEMLWPAFGAANQLIAALSLLVVSAYLFGFKRNTAFTLIPGVFMLVTTEGALVYQLFWQYIPDGNVALGAVAVILMILGLVVAVEVYRRLQRKDSVPAGAIITEG